MLVISSNEEDVSSSEEACSDDPSARETNEVFLPDDIWHEKYRNTVGNQDRKNLEYYSYQIKTRGGLNFEPPRGSHFGKIN